MCVNRFNNLDVTGNYLKVLISLVIPLTHRIIVRQIQLIEDIHPSICRSHLLLGPMAQKHAVMPNGPISVQRG